MDTSASLLDLLRHTEGTEPDHQNHAWHQMVEIYRPFICCWLERFGAPKSDVDDLLQNVMTVVVRRLPQFEHNGRPGAFRNWLKQITRNCLLEFWRSNKLRPTATGNSDFQEQLNELSDPKSELSQRWNQEYDQFVLSSLLASIKKEFKPNTWEAFYLVSVKGWKPADVAKHLGVTTNSVFIAKSRVLSRLRTAGKELVDDL